MTEYVDRPLAPAQRASSFQQGGMMRMVTLKDRWVVFGGIILDPWTLVLVVATTYLFYASTLEQSEMTSSLLSILIMLCSAVLGSRATKQWMDVTERGVLAVRGGSAVRGLKLLLRNITALERRVSAFCSDKESIANSQIVLARNYQEIIETCNLLEEETVYSIENWTDIVPGADIRTQVGMITDLKRLIKEKEDDRQAMREQLDKMKGESLKDTARLRSELKEKERQIQKLDAQLMSSQVNLGLTGVSDMTSSLSFSVPFDSSVHIGRLPKGPLPLTVPLSDVSDRPIQVGKITLPEESSGDLRANP